MNLERVAPTLALVILGVFLGTPSCSAQDQLQPSVAEAARLNREQKKTAQNSTTVITNDSLVPPLAKPVSVATVSNGATSAASAQDPARQSAATDQNAQAPSSSDSSATPIAAESPANAAKRKEQVEALKQQIKDQENQVELLRRLLKLDQDAFQSKPDFSHDADGKAKLDREEQELKDQEAALAAIKAKLPSIPTQD